jgi:signal transduction histidine kinase
VVTGEGDAAIPDLLLDNGQIREALTNLIKNAIESTAGTGRDPQVIVTIKRSDEDVIISVRDNGCGIAHENIGKLFQPYYTTKKQGSGIGLALVERIITLHGGRIEIQSKEKEGTEIRLIFKGMAEKISCI